MIIGLDFDNTIVNYDTVFHTVALEKNLISPSTKISKTSVRDAMRASDMEDEWILLQGHVYGTCMDRAVLFDGVLEFLEFAKINGHECFIISHKTKTPYRGPEYDLHEAASTFIETNIINNDNNLIHNDHFSFHQEKDEKIEQIVNTKCDVFIDDLPEILNHPHFPSSCFPVLFDPDANSGKKSNIRSVVSWNEFNQVISNFSAL